MFYSVSYDSVLCVIHQSKDSLSFHLQNHTRNANKEIFVYESGVISRVEPRNEALKGVFGRHCSPMIDGMQKKIPKEARVEGRTGRITVIRQRSSLSFFCLYKNCRNHIIEMYFVVVLFNPLSIKTY